MINNIRNRIGLGSLFFLLSVVTETTSAMTFHLPTEGGLIGAVQYVAVSDTTVNVAQHFNLGMNSLIAANPGLQGNEALSDSNLTIPTAFILPPGPHKGIVINLPEMRLYFYPPGTNEVMTFPVGIGRIGKTIPITNTEITRKVVNPTWIPTPAIRDFNREQGIELPPEMGPGPDNPLGPYAIYMRIPTYLIHSTIFPESIGKRASFGCIRMNENDIKNFFPLVTAKMPVSIINVPNKISWQGNRLYLQSYPPLEENTNSSLESVVQLVENNLPKNHMQVLVNWQMISYLVEHPDGIPHEIGFSLANNTNSN